MIKLFLLLIAIFPSVALSDDGALNYRFGAGDEVRILVYDEPDLTIETTIGDNGHINFPLIGSIAVIGKTGRQVEKIIHDGLTGDFLVNPSVQVDIISYRPFYIQGEVNSPGAYPYRPGLNIDQAIALASGLTERASTSKIYIKKTKNDDKKGSKVKLDHSVSPGDIVTIEQSFF